MIPFRLILTLTFLFLVVSLPCRAQELPLDRSDAGAVTYGGFGDSITVGVGASHSPGQFIEEAANTGLNGYVSRLSGLAGISTVNGGNSGEFLTDGGSDRFPGFAAGSGADVIGIMEGTNDSVLKVDASKYRARLQRVVNVTIRAGRTPILLTMPPTCCGRAGQRPFIEGYNRAVRDLARINGVVLADIERAFQSTCQNQSECELLNIPEGLHPNSRGYRVIAQTVLAALFGVDIFSAEGAAKLEESFELEPGTIIVRPEVSEVPAEDTSGN